MPFLSLITQWFNTNANIFANFLFFLLITHLSQTPFTFGLNQRAPYTAGDRCLLCRCERKDTVVPSEAGISGQNGTAQPAKTPSALQLPLWVCSDCRRTVEKEDRHTTLEQSLGVSHMGMKRIKAVKTTENLWLGRDRCSSSLCLIPLFKQHLSQHRCHIICSLTCTAAIFQWMMQLCVHLALLVLCQDGQNGRSHHEQQLLL